MHELSLMADLMRKIDAIARDQNARQVTRIKVTLGALSHLSASHFREHFEHAARNTLSQDAELDITVATDARDPRAQDIVLESVEVEVDDDD
jgi:hydrogenase nickel incorporation protein HypA/HybF